MSEISRRGKLFLYYDVYIQGHDEGCGMENIMLGIMLYVTSFPTNLAGCQQIFPLSWQIFPHASISIRMSFSLCFRVFEILKMHEIRDDIMMTSMWRRGHMVAWDWSMHVLKYPHGLDVFMAESIMVIRSNDGIPYHKWNSMTSLKDTWLFFEVLFNFPGVQVEYHVNSRWRWMNSPMGDELDGAWSWWDKYINDVTPIEWFPFPFFTMRHLLSFDM